MQTSLSWFALHSPRAQHPGNPDLGQSPMSDTVRAETLDTMRPVDT
jgi:hypothetical protein